MVVLGMTDRLMEYMHTQAIGDKRFVFLGEASHGTHEYYSTYLYIPCVFFSLSLLSL